MTIKPIKDHVLVRNLDFGEKITRGGIIVLDDDGTERGVHPRWAEVWRVGEEVHDIKEGQWILVQHGRWSRTAEVEENGEKIKINRVDYPSGILVISDEKSDDVYTGTAK